MPEHTPPGRLPSGDWAFPPIEPPAAPTVDPYPTAPVSPEAPAAEADLAPVAAPAVASGLPSPRRQPVPTGPVSPLRAVAGAAVAVAGVLLGIGALLWATDAPSGSPTLQQTQAQSSQLAASPTPPAVTASPAPTLTHPARPVAAPKLPLTVLNNSTRTGLAARAAGSFVSAGWPVRLIGAFRGRLTETTVYYAPGQKPSALALQKAFPGITRVLPRFAGLPGTGLTVVLTRTYPA